MSTWRRQGQSHRRRGGFSYQLAGPHLCWGEGRRGGTEGREGGTEGREGGREGREGGREGREGKRS